MAVTSVTSLLDVLGWQRLFEAGAGLALLAALVLLPTMHRRDLSTASADGSGGSGSYGRGGKAKSE